MTSNGITTAASTGRALRAAQALALVALVAALIGALGPADQIGRPTHGPAFPRLQANRPRGLVHPPPPYIPAVSQTASRDLPCVLPAPLPSANPRALSLLQRDIQNGRTLSRYEPWAISLVVSIGRRTLARIDVRVRIAPLQVARRPLNSLGVPGRWLSPRNGDVVRGALTEMPTVYGLFSSFELDPEGGPVIEVTTVAHATRVTDHQRIAWALSTLAAVTALFLLLV